MPKWHKIDEFRIEVFVHAGPAPRGVRTALADPLLMFRLRTHVRRTIVPNRSLKAVRISIRR